MALTVRIPEELDHALEMIAARQHVSKHALLLQGAELVVEREARRNSVDRAVDFVLDHDRELLDRLADA